MFPNNQNESAILIANTFFSRFFSLGLNFRKLTFIHFVLENKETLCTKYVLYKIVPKITSHRFCCG